MNSAIETQQDKKLPPMLEQYLQYKAMHPDCIIFCQVGDFYEIFFDDAYTVSRELNLTLTSRNKACEDPTPMWEGLTQIMQRRQKKIFLIFSGQMKAKR